MIGPCAAVLYGVTFVCTFSCVKVREDITVCHSNVSSINILTFNSEAAGKGLPEVLPRSLSLSLSRVKDGSSRRVGDIGDKGVGGKGVREAMERTPSITLSLVACTSLTDMPRSLVFTVTASTALLCPCPCPCHPPCPCPCPCPCP